MKTYTALLAFHADFQHQDLFRRDPMTPALNMNWEAPQVGYDAESTDRGHRISRTTFASHLVWRQLLNGRNFQIPQG